MSKIEILVGADPEVFMVNEKGFVSAHGAIPGTKKAPYKVDKGAVQVDGMALEFNIDPAKNEEEFVANLNAVMAILKDMVPGYELAAVPVAEFGAEYIASQPLEAIELGCDPDFNAWDNGAANPRPDGNASFRTGAGHVHIGWGSGFDVNDPEHLQACIMLTKQLDYYLGLGSLLYDDDTKRRTLYGAFGAFRPKPYGMEYRVLSNAWLKSDKLMSWVFRTTKKAFDDLVKGEFAANGYGKEAKYLSEERRPSKQYVKNILINLGVEIPKA